MAKNNQGCSAIVIVGAAMFFLGLLFRGCSGSSTSPGGSGYYTQAASYQPAPEATPPPVKLPLARDGTVIANPESYVPKTIILQKPVKVSLTDGANTTGTKTLPAGTEVKLKAVEGSKVYVEIDGHWEIIEASATDLLDQMAEAAGSVE